MNHIHSNNFIIRITVLILFVIAGAQLALSHNLLLSIFGILLLGSMFAHAVELQHQCLHYSAFKSKQANRIVGIMLGLPTLTSFNAYRRSHLEHHRNLGNENDTPFFSYEFIKSPTFPSFIFDALGIAHLKASLSAILGNSDSRLISLPPGNEARFESERFDYGLMGFIIVLSCFLSMFIGPTIAIKLWIIPALFVAQPLHFLIELPEHLGCRTDTVNVFQNTRTIKGNWLSSWFTNYNNFHVEHHLEPTISMSSLPTLFLDFQGRHSYFDNSYLTFYRNVACSFIVSRQVSKFAKPSERPA